MNQQPIENEFDCLAYKREVQLKIYERIKDLSTEEEVAYFQQAVESGPFAEWWKSLRQAAPTVSPSHLVTTLCVVMQKGHLVTTLCVVMQKGRSASSVAWVHNKGK